MQSHKNNNIYSCRNIKIHLYQEYVGYTHCQIPEYLSGTITRKTDGNCKRGTHATQTYETVFFRLDTAAF